MKITRFEEFLEKSVPYFIIGLLLVILLVMGSCSNAPKRNFVGESGLEIITIDGCEYLYYRGGSASMLTHKGNCKNHKPCE